MAGLFEPYRYALALGVEAVADRPHSLSGLAVRTASWRTRVGLMQQDVTLAAQINGSSSSQVNVIAFVA